MKLFSIGGTEIKCSPFLLMILPAAIVMGRISTVMIAFLSLCVHEAAHAMAAARVGCPVRSIEIQPFGFVARLDLSEASAGDAAAIFLAGPVASAALAAFSSLAESLFPVYAASGLGLKEFNLVVAAVNLLPAVPLDGGRLLLTAFSGKSRKTALTVLRASGAAVGALFLAAAALLLSVGFVNPTFFVMGVFMIAAVLGERNGNTRAALEKKPPEPGRAVTVHTVAISERTGLRRAMELLPRGGRTVIEVVDGDGRLTGRLDEARLLEAAGVLGASASLSDAVAMYGEKML